MWSGDAPTPLTGRPRHRRSGGDFKNSDRLYDQGSWKSAISFSLKMAINSIVRKQSEVMSAAADTRSVTTVGGGDLMDRVLLDDVTKHT
jgi:hypothetical protein